MVAWGLLLDADNQQAGFLGLVTCLGNKARLGITLSVAAVGRDCSRVGEAGSGEYAEGMSRRRAGYVTVDWGSGHDLQFANTLWL